MRLRPVVGKAAVPDAVRRLMDKFDYPDREFQPQLVPILPSLGALGGGGAPTITVAASDAFDASKADLECTGANDDQTILLAMSELASTGGTVWLSEGTFNISGSIDFPSDEVVLRGLGWGTLLSAVDGLNDHVITTDGKDRVGVFDLAIYGNRANQSAGVGLAVNGCIDSRFERLRITNTWSDGVNIANDTFRIDVLACEVLDAGRTGIRIGCDDGYITGNYIASNVTEGLYVFGATAQRNAIIGNSSVLNTTDGLRMVGVDNQVIGNGFQSNTGRGINAAGDRNTVVGNVCNSNTSYGIQVTSDDSVYLGNTVLLNAAGPISYGGSDNIIQHNVGDTAAGSELTIAAGVIAITTGFHTVDTQADDGTDELDTINGGMTGQLLVLKSADDARDPTVTDGTGNIVLAGGAGFTLSDTDDTITLIYDGTSWVEVSRSDNS